MPIMSAGVLDKFAVFIVYGVHCLGKRMRPGGKHLQLLAAMGDKVIDTDCQIPQPFFTAREMQKGIPLRQGTWRIRGFNY
jgi:hypothetical protein